MQVTRTALEGRELMWGEDQGFHRTRGTRKGWGVESWLHTEVRVWKLKIRRKHGVSAELQVGQGCKDLGYLQACIFVPPLPHPLLLIFWKLGCYIHLLWLSPCLCSQLSVQPARCYLSLCYFPWDSCPRPPPMWLIWSWALGSDYTLCFSVWPTLHICSCWCPTQHTSLVYFVLTGSCVEPPFGGGRP